MNLNNDIMMGKGLVFFRCGKDDHTLRNCPLPFQETLAFEPTKGRGGGKGNKEKLF